MTDRTMKRPSFQFYPADWRKDLALRKCSIAARGMWIELMCIAHECEPYGTLRHNGEALQADDIAGLVGMCSPREAKALIEELVRKGVAKVDDEGVIYSKRMVHDEAVRNARAEGGKAGAEHGAKGAEHGAKGGRPTASKGGAKGGSKTPLAEDSKPPPSSSSSSSSSSPSGIETENQGSAVRSRDQAEADGIAPTHGGALCRALRQKANFTQCNPSDPRLLALLEQGVTESEFVDVAAEAMAKGKGWAWVLAVVKARREEAAQITLPARAAADPMAWSKTRDGIVNRGCSLGIGPFDEVAACTGDGPTWPQYRSQVIAADAAKQGVAA